ncbi:YwqG family protein [Paenibacillus puldeungensis]|uniref:YwqG family protein n=1 Tax=Paenibacillus puldeungensis TaxID=696536 RepID=A0ABW3S017_9BACL
MDKKELEQLIESNGLGSVSKALLNLSRDSIRITTDNKNDENINIGRSKFGGRPDVPQGFLWPQNDAGQPLYFICQLNLNEVKPFDLSDLLPSSGILSFFYDALEQPWGYDPNDKNGFRILFFSQEPSQLIRIEEPTIFLEQGTFGSCELNYISEVCLPPWESPFIDNLNLDQEKSDNYFELQQQLTGQAVQDGLIHRIQGYPDNIQGDMYLECQLVTNGLYCGDGTGYNNPARNELEKGVYDWILLLQIDSEEEIGFMWGDVGRLYFWIREKDLKEKNFENPWVILQCG